MLALSFSFSYCTMEEDMKEVKNYGGSLETRNNANLRQAIINIFSDSVVLNYVYISCIVGENEVVSLSQMPLPATYLADINTISAAGVSEFYLPFIDMNFNLRTSMRVINLDGQTDSTQLYDLNGSLNNKTSLESNFAILFKTTAHVNDVQALGVVGGWKPWRKCYCVGRNFPGGGISSQSDCLSLTDPATGHGSCTRTGFFKQECSGEPCNY